jgi:hypothetical protein
VDVDPPPWWLMALAAVAFAVLAGVYLARGRMSGLVLVLVAMGFGVYAQQARSARGGKPH